ncbi:hypothetical protein D3C87_1704650 [compost metagenome]
MLGPCLHGLFHFQPEASAKIDRIAGDKLAIKPCGAVGRGLSLKGEIGTNRQRNTALAPRILERAQFDNGTRRTIPRRFNIGKTDIHRYQWS